MKKENIENVVLPSTNCENSRLPYPTSMRMSPTRRGRRSLQIMDSSVRALGAKKKSPTEQDPQFGGSWNLFFWCGICNWSFDDSIYFFILSRICNWDFDNSKNVRIGYAERMIWYVLIWVDAGFCCANVGCCRKFLFLLFSWDFSFCENNTFLGWMAEQITGWQF